MSTSINQYFEWWSWRTFIVTCIGTTVAQKIFSKLPSLVRSRKCRPEGPPLMTVSWQSYVEADVPDKQKTGESGAKQDSHTMISLTDQANTHTHAASLLDFLLVVGKLKTVKRTGWVNTHVHLPESVSDHMYRMSMMCFVLSPFTSLHHPSSSLSSVHHSIKMALVHDLAEAICGDITPTSYSGITKEQKKKKEAEAMLQVQQLLTRAETAIRTVQQVNTHPVAATNTSPTDSVSSSPSQVIHTLWEEYEAASSDVALFLKDVDKVEMFIQGYEYEVTQGKRLDRFFDTAQQVANKTKFPIIKDLIEELTFRRKLHVLQRDGDC